VRETYGHLTVESAAVSFNWAWDLAFEIENIYSSESHIEYFLNLEHL
jgi:hypothetical protein